VVAEKMSIDDDRVNAARVEAWYTYRIVYFIQYNNTCFSQGGVAGSGSKTCFVGSKTLAIYYYNLLLLNIWWIFYIKKCASIIIFYITYLRV
jgi:hypothetical protein